MKRKQKQEWRTPEFSWYSFDRFRQLYSRRAMRLTDTAEIGCSDKRGLPRNAEAEYAGKWRAFMVGTWERFVQATNRILERTIHEKSSTIPWMGIDWSRELAPRVEAHRTLKPKDGKQSRAGG